MLMRVSRCDLVAEREAVPNSPASLAEGIKEVRSPGRTKERKGVGGGLGIQPQRSKGGMLCNSPISISRVL